MENYLNEGFLDFSTFFICITLFRCIMQFPSQIKTALLYLLHSKHTE